MILRRVALLGLVFLAVAPASADDSLQMVATGPASQAVIGSGGEDFFVRFNRPVDHIRSVLTIRQGAKVVQKLQPRLKTEPNVLFARAPSLPAGNYTLHWSVKTLEGTDVIEGESAFSVASGKR